MSETSTSSSSLPWYKQRAGGWAYLAPLPARKLLPLYFAIFALFSIIGFYGDLTYCGGRAPGWAVIVTAVLNGAYATLYPYVLIHKPKVFLFPVILGSMTLGPVISTWLTWITLHHPQSKPGLAFDAQGVLIGVIVSYSCFIGFTRAQASAALRIQNELDLAHGIQRTLVPPIAISAGGYDLHGISVPSDKVGGDLVDVVLLANGAAVAYVADVSGHGLQAGILMGMVKTAVRTILLEDFAGPSYLLHALCDRLNRALPGVKEAHMYATLSALYLAPDGRVSYALAAHPAILHYQAASRTVTELACEQFPVGLLPVDAYISHSLQIAPGDILAITTDGILEACNGAEEEFGTARVAGLLQNGASNQDDGDLETTARGIMQSVQAFGKQVDDQTLLLVRRRLDTALRQDAAA